MNKDLENEHKKRRNQEGITLIALVITIILLLILSVITINLAIGENGIIKTAKEAGESYKITQIKEIIESEIIAMDTEKLLKGEDLTVEQALIGIEENGIFEEIDLAEESGIREGYIIQLGYNENGKVVILSIEKDVGTRLEITLNPTGYTNENVEVSITVKSNKSNITDIEVPQEMAKKENGTYEVSKNGTYHVIANLDNGQTIEKDITIGNIDKLAPKNPEISISKIEDGFIIKVTTEDEEATKESLCSGIEKYEYYIDGELKKTDIKNECTINGLNVNRIYNVCVKVYDRATNIAQTQIEESTLKYVWEKYDVKEKNYCEAYEKTTGTMRLSNSKYYRISTSYVISEDGGFKLSNVGTFAYGSNLVGKYYLDENSSGSELKYFESKISSTDSSTEYYYKIYALKVLNTEYSQGTTRYDDVYGDTQHQYPDNGRQGDYWYIYKGLE